MSSETVLNNRYRLTAQQGSGGMAVIYKAIDQALGRTVAVKILRPSLTDDPAFLARFRNEARSVANLTHPNIVTVHDVGNDGPTHYIVMEFVEGQDLKRIIRAEGALGVDRALNLAIQICAGIGFAHRAGLVHADVKPQNILVTRDDTVKVTDFGIAQALTDTQPGEKQSVVWGSPHYFAPEQARGERPTPASDVYSIGIVLFEMLTGRLPYSGANQQELALAHIRDRIPHVTEFNPEVPEALSSIVYKVMGKEPSTRYRMADQLGNILISYRDRHRQGSSVSIPPAPRSAAPTVANQSVVPAPPWPNPPAPTAVPGRPEYGHTEPGRTQSYGLAPNAPQVGPYGRPAAPAPYSGNSGSERLSGTSGYYQSQLYTPENEPPPSALDVVTIALAVLAFFSVACLIPLYIAVFQARFGG
ncbi:MAG: protein kinase [Chloroflexota bacterium]